MPNPAPPSASWVDEYTGASTYPVQFGPTYTHASYATWIEVIGAGTIVLVNEDGSSATFVCGGGEVLSGTFKTLTSMSATRVRLGNGRAPDPIGVPPVATAGVAGAVQLAGGLGGTGSTAALPVLNVASPNVSGQLPIANVAPGTAAQIPVTNAGATALAHVTVSGDVAITSAGAATVSKVNGIQPFAIAPVAAVSVANQATLTGTAQTIDGVALNAAGMRVYLAAQSTAAQNGIWVVQSGAWTRPTDWPTGGTPPVGTTITVAPGGSTNFPLYGALWYVSATAVIDTGTVTAYPKIVKGHGALVSGTPSAITVSNLWIATGAEIQATNQTTQANPVKAVYTAGAGSGSLTVTGPNTVTDQVSYLVTNA